jgi:hypothetical protein
MAWKVIKIPCPNVQQFVARIPGHVLDLLHFQAQIMRQTAILDKQGKTSANMMLGVWMLIDDQGGDEDHQFVLIQSGIDLPVIDAELTHVGTTILLLPTGNHLEFHLFHAGETMEFSGMDIPTQESPLPK